MELTNDKAIINIASFSDEDTDAFTCALDSFISSEAAEVTTEYFASKLELESLEKCNASNIVEHDALYVDVSPNGVSLTGPKFVVRNSLHRIKDLLKNVTEKELALPMFQSRTKKFMERLWLVRHNFPSILSNLLNISFSAYCWKNVRTI